MQDYHRGQTKVLVAWHHQVQLPEVEFLQLTCPMQLKSDYLNVVYGCMMLPADYPEEARLADSDNKLVVIDNTLMSETFGSTKSETGYGSRHPAGASYEWQRRPSLLKDVDDELE